MLLLLHIIILEYKNWKNTYEFCWILNSIYLYYSFFVAKRIANTTDRANHMKQWQSHNSAHPQHTNACSLCEWDKRLFCLFYLQYKKRVKWINWIYYLSKVTFWIQYIAITLTRTYKILWKIHSKHLLF